MEIRTLRNFIAVVQEEGVTAAADVLRVSQPALSRQIKGLESEMGRCCSYAVPAGGLWN